MADIVKSNLRYLPQAVSTQSILDVFVLQNVIDQDDASTLRTMFKTNRELETFLVKNNLVTRDSINKAYGILLKLPYIELKNVLIPVEARKIFPENISRKYGAIPFAFTDNLLRLAVAHPADMLVGFKTGLLDFFDKKGVEIELFVTGETDFSEAVKQYRPPKSNKSLLKKGSLPVVYLQNQAIAEKYIHKLPLDFIEKNRVVVIGQNQAGEYLLACEKPDDARTLKIVQSLRQENNIKVELFATSRSDIDFVVTKLKELSQSPESKTVQKGESIQNLPDFTVDKIEKVETSSPPMVESAPKGGDAVSFKSMVGSLLGVNERAEMTIDDISTPKKDDQIKNTLAIDPSQQQKRDQIAEGIRAGDKESLQAAGIKVTNIENGTSDLVDNSDNNKSGKQKLESVDKSGNPHSAEATRGKQESEGIEQGSTENDQKINQNGGLLTSQADQPAKVEDTAVSSAPQILDTESQARDASGLANEDIGSLVKEDIRDEKMLAESCKGGYIPKIVASVINYALTTRASDIHVEPLVKSLRIRCRVDGVMKEALDLPLSFHPPFVSRIKILSKLKIDEMRIPQDGRFDVVFNKREVDVRVSTLPTVHGEKVVMRILDKSQSILSLEDLGVMGTAQKDTVEAIGKPFGVILATGPTGSGKSTTLYAILNRISVPGVNVITLEDPVEYEIAGINQCQVKPEIGFTFASGLRSVLRQDPNIIMVGEIRDSETANMATHAALTGHLVLSTLHTNDTAGALPRLINMGIEPFLITSAINLIIAQRLVRRICPKCKQEMKVPEKLMEQIKGELDKISPQNVEDRARFPKEWKLYYGKGCDECNNGFKGRLGIYEVMKITPEIEELAIGKRPANEIKEQSIKNGMLTMRQDGILKAFAGETTIDEIFQAVVENKSEDAPVV
ncbi:MAG: ATPase, T2SS/T4P/T4SS family [Candidatus Berkelbacteria bacterium]